MDILLSVDFWSALITLTVLEVVLGIDNIIFLTLLVNNLPEHQRKLGRRLGLLGAMGTRILLLLSIAWVAQLVTPLFHIMDQAVSGRDLILLFGGLFLIYKAVTEIHTSFHGHATEGAPQSKAASFLGVMVQIAVIDIVFSLDSVITAVGLAQSTIVMVTAIVIAIGVMMFAAEAIGNFVEKNPTIKMLALAFLVLVGAVLVADGLGHHVPKGYLYFAILFSLGVEFLNLKMRSRTQKQEEQNIETLRLHQRHDTHPLVKTDQN